MPTYEYQCDACNHNFDEFQSIKEEPLKTCPKCGKDQLRRVFGAGAAIIFKGSGFYQTDYRSESYKAGAKAEESAGKASKDSTTGSDGKNGSAGSNGAGKTEQKSSSSTT